MRSTNTRLLVAVAVSASTLLAACAGSGEDGAATNATDTTSAATVVTTAPAPTVAPSTEAPTTTVADTVAPTTPPPDTVVPAAPPTIDELLGLGRPLVLAHTAGEDEFPASTLFAFSESVKAGVDMLDFNVQLSADDVLVVHHDDTVDRPTNGSGPVAHLTYAELAQLDNAYWFTANCVCTDQPEADYVYRGIRTGAVPPPAGYTPDDFAIPRLRDVIEAFPNMPLGIEIKGTGEAAAAAATVLAAEIEEFGLTEHVVVSSFDDATIAFFQDIAPDVEVSPGVEALTAFVLGGTPLPAGQRILQIPPEFEGITVITDALITAAHEAGAVIWVWPNKRELETYDSYLNFLRMGLDGLNINFPADGVRAVADYLAESS
jgi:glycerophosphoryl diester phosphodiesterase